MTDAIDVLTRKDFIINCVFWSDLLFIFIALFLVLQSDYLVDQSWQLHVAQLIVSGNAICSVSHGSDVKAVCILCISVYAPSQMGLLPFFFYCISYIQNYRNPESYLIIYELGSRFTKATLQGQSPDLTAPLLLTVFGDNLEIYLQPLKRALSKQSTVFIVNFRHSPFNCRTDPLIPASFLIWSDFLGRKVLFYVLTWPWQCCAFKNNWLNIEALDAFCCLFCSVTHECCV